MNECPYPWSIDEHGDLRLDALRDRWVYLTEKDLRDMLDAIRAANQETNSDE